MKRKYIIFALLVILIASLFLSCLMPFESRVVNNTVVTDCYGDINPCADNTYSLGNITTSWHHGYFNELNASTIINNTISTNRIYNDNLLIDAISDNYSLALDDFSSWGQILVPTGATVSAPTRVTMYTGIGANSSALRYCEVAPIRYGAAPASIDWDKKFVTVFSIVRINSDVQCIGRVQIKEGVAIGQLIHDGIGLQINNFTLTGETYGAAGRSTVALTTVLTGALCYGVMIVHIPGVSVQFWIDSGTGWILEGTIIDTTRIPSGTAGAWDYVITSLENGAGGGVNCEMSLYKPYALSYR